MEKLKSKKGILVLSCIVAAVFIALVINNQIQSQRRIDEYIKYCQAECELTKVSKIQLEETKSERQQVAIDNITKYKKNIDDINKYLVKQKLNDEEAKKLSNLVIEKEYDVESEYSIDELIEIENQYSEISKQITDLKTEFRTRYLTSKINSNKKSILKTQKSIKSYNLTSTESETKKKLDKKLTFDSKKVYTVKQLSELNETYNTVKKKYDELLTQIKERVKTEEEQAKAALAQSTANNSSSNAGNNNYSNNSNNSNNNSTSSNSNNNNNSNGEACYDSQGRYNSACITSYEYNGNANEVPVNICPYKSESAASSFAAAHVGKEGYTGGYAILPCSEGTWEIGWF